MNPGRLNVIMLAGNSNGTPYQSPMLNPNTLVIDIRYGWMARRGVVIKAVPNVAKFVLAVASRPSAIVNKEEIFELLWGYRKDGGPGLVENRLTAYWAVASAALVALGYASKRLHGRGFSAWPVAQAQRDDAAICIPRFLSGRAEERV